MSRREPWPRRPWIPPVLLVLCGALVVARLVLWSTDPGRVTIPTPSWLWWILLWLSVGAGVLFGTRDRWRPEGRSGRPSVPMAVRAPLLGAVALCAGMAIAVTSLERQAETHRTLSSRPVSSICLRIERDATPTETGWWTSAVVVDGPRSVGDVWVSSSVRFLAGDVLKGVGHYEANGDDEFGASSRMRGICGTIRLVAEPDVTQPRGPLGLFRALRQRLVGAIDPMADEGRALVAAAVLGEREGLRSFGLDEDFSRAGLSHLVAVSGLHVALATSLLSLALLRLRCPRRVRIGCLVAWGGVYVALCGAPASALRSLAMSGAAQGADLAGRRAHALGAVGIVGLAMALVDVSCVGDLGFVLSISCVAGLAILSRWAGRLVEVVWPDVAPRRLRARTRRRLVALQRTLRGTLAASLVCLMVSLPLAAASFDAVSLLSPLSSVLVTPLFEAFLAVALPASLAGALPLVGPWLVEAVSWPARGIVLLVGGFGRLPSGQAHLPIGEPWATLAVPLAVAAIYRLWPQPARRQVLAISAAAVALVLGWWYVRPLLVPPRVVVLDVGQGDAILVQDGPHSLLVDTGPDASVAEALSREGVAGLDAVVFTHEHADHAGGFPSLRGSVPVGSLYVPEGQAEALSDDVRDAVEAMGCPVVEVARGDRIAVGRFRLTVLWPEGPEDGDENDECLVARLDYAGDDGRLRALLTGDAESDVLDELVDRNEVGDLDLLKVGHHGSEVSVDAGALRSCRPEVAVASAGEGNEYGHPDPVCVETCEAAGALFLCTKDVGDVEVRPGAAGPVVSTRDPIESP